MASIRLRLQPSRPSANTCCCLLSLKTLPIPAKDHLLPRLVNVPALPHMAGFEVIMYGRLWVITEACAGVVGTFVAALLIKIALR